MTNQDAVISLLESKIEQVIHVAENFRSDNERLQQRVDELSGVVNAKNLEVEVLESKYQSLKLSASLVSSSEDVKNAKLQVNRIVREIDKCIALLNK